MGRVKDLPLAERTYHLRQGDQTVYNVVVINIWVLPTISFIQTYGFVGNLGSVKYRVLVIDAFVKFPTKQLNAHDTED